MNKNAIKKFAIEARKKLIASVSDRVGMLGITAEGCSEPISKGIDFEVYKTVAGTEVTLGRTQFEQRRKLKEQIEARGFEAVVEEVAYTWFNRICAIRFMEVNDYLPTRVRVLSSEKEGKNEPDIVTQAPDVDLDFTDKEREYILDCKMNNKLDDLFKMLFIKQCNKLSEILPELFEATEDYTEMLLNISYTNKDDIIHMLVNQETGIPEADFNVSTIGEDGQPTGQVEIIGWLYQYYNTELKDDTFAQLKKNVKISKERIPAATQLFTPDWIVRYMVENSVGRLWIEHLRAVDQTVNEKEVAERFGWKYYLPEAEQEAEVNVKLAEIRTSYKDLKPEDITCIDPCMGSGHILVAMFDVLMDIYKSAGYSERDAAFEIVENNIHGLDIDKRAYQLAYFAVMMKGRGYNRRFFRGKSNVMPQPRVYAIQESNGINRAQLNYFGVGLNEIEKKNALNQLIELINTFIDAREYGSIINIGVYDWKLLLQFINKYDEVGQISFDTLGLEIIQERLRLIINIAKTLADKYDIVSTNPPYMAISGANDKVNNYVKEYYSDSKTDLFAVFIERVRNMTAEKGFYSMITQHAWMFLPSYEKLRGKLKNNTLINMTHLGTRAFDEIGGEVVQTTSFVYRNHMQENYNTIYKRLVDFYGEEEKEKQFFVESNLFVSSNKPFDLVDGKPLIYWADKSVFESFKVGKSVSQFADVKRGMTTSDNNRFLRFWAEVDYKKIGFGYMNRQEAFESKKMWFPYSKGGGYRKWYGYQEYVVDWENDGERVIEFAKTINKSYTRTIVNMDYYFLPSVGFSYITSGPFCMRWIPAGFVYDSGGPGMFGDEVSRKKLIACMNSKPVQYILKLISPTINLQIADIVRVPFLWDEKFTTEIEHIVEQNIEISKQDWDSYETSWDFKRHPFLCYETDRIEEASNLYSERIRERRRSLTKNEERLNEIFIDIYNMGHFMGKETSDLSISDVNESREMKGFISYIIGCIFGRYSLDADGLVYAGGEWDATKYNSFLPAVDNIIPITDAEYFSDDIVGRFCEWLKVVYGEDTLEENLDFIARTLGNKGTTSREVIRNYFVNDFMADHIKTYQKRPIYWLFDSGKTDGFKALLYMHRYNPETVGKVRIDYLHKTQKAIEQAMISAEYVRNNGSGSEKAKATKLIARYTKQLAEMHIYDEAMAHIANQRMELDLDDGVKVNYAKFQGVEVVQEGKKALKIDLLAKI